MRFRNSVTEAICPPRVTDIYCHTSAGRRTTAALPLVGDLLLHYRRSETYCVRTGGRGATVALPAGARLATGPELHTARGRDGTNQSNILRWGGAVQNM